MTGKEKCEALKQLRKLVAKANGIKYEPAECNFQGECLGYCEKCDSEAKYLESELERLLAEGKSVAFEDLLKINTENEAVGEDVGIWDTDSADGYIDAFDPESKVIMEMLIEDLDLSAGVYYALKNADIHTVGDLVNVTEDELLDMGITPLDVEELEKKLRALWTAFESTDENYMGDISFMDNSATMGIIMPPKNPDPESELLGDIAPEDSIFDNDDE